MPHLQCAGCRTRHRRALILPNAAAETCPDCGADLELVDDLTALVGLRAVTAPSDPARELPEAVAVALHLPDSVP